MSVHILDKEKIDRCVAALTLGRDGPRRGRYILTGGWEYNPAPLTKDEYAQIGRLLWSMNLEAAKARYPGDKDGDRPGPNDFKDGDIEAYTYGGLRYSMPRLHIEAVGELTYNSDEACHLDWCRELHERVEYVEGRVCRDIVRAMNEEAA